MGTLTELPVGEYDVKRTLRHLLAQAEKGEFNYCLVICHKVTKEPEPSDQVWACWSNGMNAQQIWYLAGWLLSYIQRRYFRIVDSRVCRQV